MGVLGHTVITEAFCFPDPKDPIRWGILLVAPEALEELNYLLDRR